MKSKGHNRGGKRIIVGATGASGLPILVKCLELIGEQPVVQSRYSIVIAASRRARQDRKSVV